jgi:hypothetical protein
MHILSLRTWGKVNAFTHKKYRKPIVLFIKPFVYVLDSADIHKFFPFIREVFVPLKTRFTHFVEWYISVHPSEDDALLGPLHFKKLFRSSEWVNTFVVP